jgi:uncharacterized membrane protein YsdA (DUF1294 family)
VVVCWSLYAFLAVANVAGYLAAGYDKSAAKRQHRANPPRRLSENKLWALSFFGGFLGLIIGFARFRHKTRKKGFLFVFFLAAFVSTIVWTGWLTVLDCLPA